MITFGSCNRQKLPQTFWPLIGSLHPSHFFWIGDAIYAKGQGVASIKEAFDLLIQNSSYYKQFIHATNVTIDGVWDDHDYGKNDAGSEFIGKNQQRQLYLNFLDEPRDSDRYT